MVAELVQRRPHVVEQRVDDLAGRQRGRATGVDQHVGQARPGGPPARGPDQFRSRRGERRPGAGGRPQRGQHERPGQPGQRERVVQQRDRVADPHLERRVPGGGRTSK